MATLVVTVSVPGREHALKLQAERADTVLELKAMLWSMLGDEWPPAWQRLTHGGGAVLADGAGLGGVAPGAELPLQLLAAGATATAAAAAAAPAAPSAAVVDAAALADALGGALANSMTLTTSAAEQQARAAMEARIGGCSESVLGYEDELKQVLALSVVPMDELVAAAGTDARGRKLLQALLAWFKGWFSWTNAPACGGCGGATQCTGMVAPTAEEASFGASRVEDYGCAACSARTRFPRYNDPAILLQTRNGRCGEWANCFTLIARSVGFEGVRLVHDWTDHGGPGVLPACLYTAACAPALIWRR